MDGFERAEEVRGAAGELLRKGFIQRSRSSWGALVIFTAKVDGSLLLRVDYREFNKLTIKKKYPLPRIDDLFDQLSGARVFSQMDLAMGFHQLRVAEESVSGITFRTP